MHATTARGHVIATMRLASGVAHVQPPDGATDGMSGSSVPSLRAAPSGDVDVTTDRRTTRADVRDKVVLAARAPAGPE